MAMLNRTVKIPIVCPECKHEMKETIARLEANPTLTCDRCRASIEIKAEQLKGVLADLERRIRDLGR